MFNNNNCICQDAHVIIDTYRRCHMASMLKYTFITLSLILDTSTKVKVTEVGVVLFPGSIVYVSSLNYLQPAIHTTLFE